MVDVVQSRKPDAGSSASSTLRRGPLIDAKRVLSAASVCVAVLTQGAPYVAVSGVGTADTRSIRSSRAEVPVDTRLPITVRSAFGSADTAAPGFAIILR